MVSYSFSSIFNFYFRGLGLRLGFHFGLGLVWCYGPAKFWVRVRIRVRLLGCKYVLGYGYG